MALVRNDLVGYGDKHGENYFYVTSQKVLTGIISFSYENKNRIFHTL